MPDIAAIIALVIEGIKGVDALAVILQHAQSGNELTEEMKVTVNAALAAAQARRDFVSRELLG